MVLASRTIEAVFWINKSGSELNPIELMNIYFKASMH